jgi:hypothetical protein
VQLLLASSRRALQVLPRPSRADLIDLHRLTIQEAAAGQAI